MKSVSLNNWHGRIEAEAKLESTVGKHDQKARLRNEAGKQDGEARSFSWACLNLNERT